MTDRTTTEQDRTGYGGGPNNRPNKTEQALDLDSNRTEQPTEQDRTAKTGVFGAVGGERPPKGGSPSVERTTGRTKAVLTEIIGICRRLEPQQIQCERLAAMAREAEFLGAGRYPRWEDLAAECRTVAKRWYESRGELTGSVLESCARGLLS